MGFFSHWVGCEFFSPTQQVIQDIIEILLEFFCHRVESEFFYPKQRVICKVIMEYILGFFLIWSLSFLPKEQQQQVYLIGYDKIWVLFLIWLEMSFVSQTFFEGKGGIWSLIYYATYQKVNELIITGFWIKRKVSNYTTKILRIELASNGIECTQHHQSNQSEMKEIDYYSLTYMIAVPWMWNWDLWVMRPLYVMRYVDLCDLCVWECILCHIVTHLLLEETGCSIWARFSVNLRI